MYVWRKKIPSGALQFVVFIGVVIAILLAAFIMLIHTRTLFRKQSGFTIETVINANYGIDYALSGAVPLQDSVKVNLFDEPYKTLSVHKTYWGVLEKTTAVSRVKNKEFVRLALLGGYTPPKERATLYVKDNNRPLVVVGDTRIEGMAFLPEAGIKAGNISGHAYYGSALVYGKTAQSRTDLPGLPETLSGYLESVTRGDLPVSEDQVLSPEEGGVYKNSFLETTKYLYTPGELRLQGVSLIGNIIVYSSTRIIADRSAVLKDVVLIAPEIVIEDGTKGVFQAVATKKIRTGKNCAFGYPSALVVWEEEKENAAENISGSEQGTGDSENGIRIGEGTVVKGIVMFHGVEKENNYTPQIVMEEGTNVYGEVYCNQNTELMGRVTGSVFTGNFIASQSGSIYQNHLYNAVISEAELPEEYVGLIMETKQKGVVKWLY
ncbi:hypothetical protein [Sinomicrobium sp. M5D2P9]